MNRLAACCALVFTVGLSTGQAQYTFMPNAQRLSLLDSLRRVAQPLQHQPPSFGRDTALFHILDRYHYHNLDVNRPFTEVNRTMLILPDSMYRLAARHNWQPGLIKAAIYQANAITYLGDKPAGVRLYREALERCRHHPMPHEQAIALINLAACFAYRKEVSPQDWERTNEYMNQALQIARKYHDVENIHQYYNLMGDFHVIKKRYAEALPFYKKEQPLMDRHRHLSGYRTNLAYLGICYLHTHQEAKAWPILNRFKAISDPGQGAYATYLHYIVLFELGRFYLSRKDYAKALLYQRQYEKNLPERTLFDRTHHYEAMSQIYAGLNDYRRAYAYQQRYIGALDSLRLENTARRFADIQEKLAREQGENQRRAQQNQTQRNWLFFLGSLFVFSLCLSGLLLYMNRLRKQAIVTKLAFSQQQRETNARIIQTGEIERQRIAADLHDDLGGTLATIHRQLGDVRRQLPASAAGGLVELESLLQKSTHDLRTIAYNLMPPEFARLGLCNTIEQLVRNQPDRPPQFSFGVAGTERRLPPAIELNLYRIVSELVHNIQKHAQARQAAVQLLYYDDHLTISVEDDGIVSAAKAGNLAT